LGSLFHSSTLLPWHAEVLPHHATKSVTYVLNLLCYLCSEPAPSGLLLFVCRDNTAAAMRTLPIALLEVGARVSDLFTTVLACYRDVLLFRHAPHITESCLECIRRERQQRSEVVQPINSSIF